MASSIIFGKYATVLGTLLVSVFTQITGNSSIGVLSIAVLFIIGFRSYDESSREVESASLARCMQLTKT